MSQIIAAEEEKAACDSIWRRRWVKTTVMIALFLVVSFGMSALITWGASRINLPLNDYAWMAYLTVFAATFVSGLTIVAPVPLALAVIATASVNFNPALVALAAATGGSLGEMSGYIAGRMGRNIILPETAFCRMKAIFCFSTIQDKVRQHGAKAIFILALQPIMPFDVGGLVAGAVKMPVKSFLPAVWAGRVPKFMLVAYLGAGFFNHISIPFLGLKIG